MTVKSVNTSRTTTGVMKTGIVWVKEPDTDWIPVHFKEGTLTGYL